MNVTVAEQDAVLLREMTDEYGLSAEEIVGQAIRASWALANGPSGVVGTTVGGRTNGLAFKTSTTFDKATTRRNAIAAVTYVT